jgi:hypothetical protein
MFTRAVVVADESATPEVSEVVEALRAACGPECAITELIDAPIRSMLTGIDRALRSSGPTDTTLVLFCGDIARGLDGHLYYTCVAEDPTPMNAVLVDVLVDVLTSAQSQVVTVFDCVMEERDEFARDPIRVLESGLAASPVNSLIADASTEGVGGIARLVAEGLRAPDADLDDDGVISVHELFAYVERGARAAGVPQDAIAARARDAALPLAPIGGYEHTAQYTPANPVALEDYADDAESTETLVASRPRRSGSRTPLPEASPPRKRRVRLIAAIGAITVAALAIFGGIARSIGNDDVAPTRTTVTSVQAYTASGTVELPDTCTNVPARLEITVDAAKIPANLTIAAMTRLDNEPESTSVLERIADPKPGDGLYVASVGPFAHSGTLSWRLLLNNPVSTKNVAMRCGGNLPAMTSTSTPTSSSATATTLG